MWDQLPDDIQKIIIRFAMLNKDVSSIRLYSINKSIQNHFLSLFDEYPRFSLLYAKRIVFCIKMMGPRLSRLLIERSSSLRSCMLSIFVTRNRHLITCPFDVIVSAIPTFERADKSSFSLFKSFIDMPLDLRSSCAKITITSFLEKIDAKSLVNNYVQYFCADINTVKWLENIRQCPLEELINTSNIKTCIKV